MSWQELVKDAKHKLKVNSQMSCFVRLTVQNQRYLVCNDLKWRKVANPQICHFAKNT